jgi:hypothetical protein
VLSDSNRSAFDVPLGPRAVKCWMLAPIAPRGFQEHDWSLQGAAAGTSLALSRLAAWERLPLFR